MYIKGNMLQILIDISHRKTQLCLSWLTKYNDFTFSHFYVTAHAGISSQCKHSGKFFLASFYYFKILFCLPRHTVLITGKFLSLTINIGTAVALYHIRVKIEPTVIQYFSFVESLLFEKLIKSTFFQSTCITA